MAKNTENPSASSTTDDHNLDVDYLSSLPLFVLHMIMTGLPLRDAVRLSILSKQLCYAWRTFPIFDFDFFTFLSNLHAFDEGDDGDADQNAAAFMSYMESSLRRLPESETDLRIEKMRMMVPDDLGFVSFLKAFTYAVTRNVKELDFVFLPRVSVFDHSLYSVKSVVVYKLVGLKLNLFRLLQGCPLVQELRLTYCDLEENIIVQSNKLKTLEIRYCRGPTSYSIHALNLECLTYANYTFRLCTFEIINSFYLTFLSMTRFLITDAWLENLIRGSPLLGFLELDCSLGLTNISISHGELRTIKLYNWIGKGSVKRVDAPKLRYFVYKGVARPFEDLNIPASVLQVTLVLSQLVQTLDSPLIQLRQLLLQFGDCKMLKLVFQILTQEISCIRRLGNERVPLIFGIKELEIECSVWPWHPEIFVDLVESFLWICPDIEMLQLTSGHGKTFIKIERKTMTKCWACNQPLTEDCWKNYLTKTIFESIEGRDEAGNSVIVVNTPALALE